MVAYTEWALGILTERKQITSESLLYGSIFLPPTRKNKICQHDYVPMLLIFVKMQHDYVASEHNYVACWHTLHVGGRSMPP